MSSISKLSEPCKMVLDIETDGSSEQNILQISYIIADRDNHEVKRNNLYVYDGIHTQFYHETSITEDEFIEQGISQSEACKIMNEDLKSINTIVGHNIEKFDMKQLKKFFLSNGFDFPKKIIHDTMKEGTLIVKAKNKNGNLKSPNLPELYDFFFKKKFENYHNAIYDCEATLECYKMMCKRGYYKILQFRPY